MPPNCEVVIIAFSLTYVDFSHLQVITLLYKKSQVQQTIHIFYLKHDATPPFSSFLFDEGASVSIEETQIYYYTSTQDLVVETETKAVGSAMSDWLYSSGKWHVTPKGPNQV
jgi:hypothetical protein